MRYPAKKWNQVAILMRDSSYSILEALSTGPKSWKQLKEASTLTDGGLQNVLRELIKHRVVDTILVAKEGGLKDKKYVLTKKAEKERIYEKAKDLKASLDRL